MAGAYELDYEWDEDGEINVLVLAPGVGLAAVELSRTDRGANQTTVIIKNAPSEYDRYALLEPSGEWVYANARLRSNGDLVFPAIPVMDVQHEWTVVGDGSPLVRFHMPGVEISRICHYEYSEIDERTLWTPTAVAHAPYLGTGVAGSSNGKASFQHIDANTGSTHSYSKTSSFEWGVDVAVSDGRTAGDFQLAVWTRADVYVRCQDTPWTRHYVGQTAYIAESLSATLSGKELYGNSRQTDSDDVESFSHQGYSSVKFKNRYVDLEHVHEHEGASTSSYQYQKKVVSHVGGSATIGGEIFSIGYKWQYKQGTSTHGKITFREDDPICVAIDWLVGGEAGGGWNVRPAFDTLTDDECAEAIKNLADGHIHSTPDIKYRVML